MRFLQLPISPGFTIAEAALIARRPPHPPHEPPSAVYAGFAFGVLTRNYQKASPNSRYSPLRLEVQISPSDER